jgi:hypothetical protein
MNILKLEERISDNDSVMMRDNENHFNNIKFLYSDQ